MHIVGIDIFTNQKYEENSPSTHNIEVPEVKRVEYSVSLFFTKYNAEFKFSLIHHFKSYQKVVGIFGSMKI